MSDIDRLFRQLVRTIQTNFPAYLKQPFEVAELYQNILPYRHHRRELGLETNQEYEMALAELLSGAGGYLIVDERMRDTLRRELASRNPDPGSFREFAATHVSLDPDAVARVLGAGTAAAAASTPTPTAPSSAPSVTAERRAESSPTQAPAPAARSATSIAPPTPHAPTPNAPPAASPRSSTAASRPSLTPSPPRLSTPVATGRPSQTGITPTGGETCRYCGGALPPGRRITFCPHCGQNLTVVNCPACGTELELGWKYCTTCGRPASTA